MNRVTEAHAWRNALTRDCWQSYASHRQRVMQLLLEANRSSADRICVLGAGNCNDLELGRLTEVYGEVHLVDLDGPTLAAAAERQGVAGMRKLHLHGSVDVTGVGPVMGSWSPERAPVPGEVDASLAQVADFRVAGLPGPFDVVTSACLLSQLFEDARTTLGDRHPRFLDLVFALRNQHFRLMVQSLVTGGRFVLLTDVVSSDTFPELPQVSQEAMQATLMRLIQDRNFFTGLNPYAVQTLLMTDPWLAPRLQQVSVDGPWRWQVVTKWFFVCAVLAARSTVHG